MLRTFILGTGSYHFGYYCAILNPLAEPLLTRIYGVVDPTEVAQMQGNLNMYYTLGAMISVLISGKLADKIGRIKLLSIVECCSVVVLLLHSIKNYHFLLLMRFLSGMISSQGSTVGMISIKEMMPAKYVGFGGLLLFLCQVTFTEVAYLANPLYGNDKEKIAENWRVLLVVPVLFSAARCFCLLQQFEKGQIESPTFLLQSVKPQEIQEVARPQILMWYRKVYTEEYSQTLADQTIKDYLEKLQKPQPSVMNMFSAPYLGKFIQACNLNILQQLMGINFLLFFSTQIFDRLSGNGGSMTILCGAMNMVGALVGMESMKKWGRKGNLLYGSIGQFAGFLILSFGILISSAFFSAVGVMLYMVSFSVGTGPIVPLYCSEIIPAVGMGMAIATQWFMATVVGKMCPILLISLGTQGLLWIFIIFCAFTAWYIHKYCHETQGCTQEEIEAKFKS